MVKMSLSIYKKGYYEEFHALGRRKNKANSKPNKAKQSQSRLAPRFIWGLKTRFEKTNPILKWVNWR